MLTRGPRSSRKRPDRAEYLIELAQEYYVTSSLEAKQQVLANLANFAYDPQNYACLWQANAVDLFIASLAEHNALLKEFGAGGLANICQDRKHRDYVLSDDNCTEALKDLVIQYSTGDHDGMTTDGVLNAIVALIYLIEPSLHHAAIISQPLENALIRLASQDSAPIVTPGRQQVRTMASLFLADYFQR